MARLSLAVFLCVPLAACEPVAIALLGAGASVAMRYNLDGVASRTFTATSGAVKGASLVAIERMGLTLESQSSLEDAELIVATAKNREIQIEVEPITTNATRMRITARTKGPFFDNATALELVQQTEKILDAATAAAAGASPAKVSASRPAQPKLTAN